MRPALPVVMYSKARIAGHPIHPMLVALPIGMYVATVATLLAYLQTADLFYYRAAMVANIAGVVAALVAAAPGAVDLFSLPRGSTARATAVKHGALALLTTGVFAVSAALLWRGWTGGAHNGEILAATLPLAVSLVGLLSLLIVGGLGWTLVQTHHVGVKPAIIHAGHRQELDINDVILGHHSNLATHRH